MTTALSHPTRTDPGPAQAGSTGPRTAQPSGAAVRQLGRYGSSTRDRRVCALLGLQDEQERTLDRYRPIPA